MKRLAVIGNPVAHSLSPLIFNTISNKYNIDSHYTRICGNSYLDILNLLELLKIDAYNITAPFKKVAFENTKNISIEVKDTSAANFIIRNKELEAFNTDYFALSKILKNNNINISSNVLILGFGATAETSVCVLKNLCFKNITIAVRSINSIDVKSLKNMINLINIKEIISFKNYDLVINTIPINEFISSEMIDNPELTIIDALYNHTYLDDSNCKYIAGLEWLAEQALPVIENIFRIHCHPNEVKEILTSYKPLKNNIILTGFMASGKSTIGRLFSEKLGWNFIDTDFEIKKKMNLDISSIFDRFGEDYFRQLEKDIILNLPNDGNNVIAIGGGALNSNHLADFIKSNYYVIYLYSNLDDIKNRLLNENNNDRPLAIPDNLESLFIQREKNYFSASDLIIYNNKNLVTIVNKLYDEIYSIF